MKKVTRGNIAQPSLKFYNVKTGKIQADIWDELCAGLWRNYNINNRLYNAAAGATKQCEWEPIFKDLYPIYPGFDWDFANNCLKENIYHPIVQDATFGTFLNVAESFFHQFDGKKIGVHLSGGLDSSLIIGLLHYFKIPFVAIGLTSERFEFRTERYIQQKLMDWAEYAELIDFDEYPSYSSLMKKQGHQIPDSFIKMNEASDALSSAFLKHQVSVVLTGQGGDSVFADPIPNIGFNIGNEFNMQTDEEYVYAPKGIRLISFFSDLNVINQIYSLRMGQKYDALKIWARHFFRSFLPKELVDYSYNADFFGLSMSGLEMAKPTIKLLFEEAYDYLQHPIFSNVGIKEFIETDVFSLEHKTYIEYCTKISIAVWLHSLFRKDE